MVYAVFVAHYSRDKLYRNLTGLPQQMLILSVCNFRLFFSKENVKFLFGECKKVQIAVK